MTDSHAGSHQQRLHCSERSGIAGMTASAFIENGYRHNTVILVCDNCPERVAALALAALPLSFLHL